MNYYITARNHSQISVVLFVSSTVYYLLHCVYVRTALPLCFAIAAQRSLILGPSDLGTRLE